MSDEGWATVGKAPSSQRSGGARSGNGRGGRGRGASRGRGGRGRGQRGNAGSKAGGGAAGNVDKQGKVHGKSLTPCRDFNSPEGCRRGDRCWFAHTPAATTAQGAAVAPASGSSGGDSAQATGTPAALGAYAAVLTGGATRGAGDVAGGAGERRAPAAPPAPPAADASPGARVGVVLLAPMRVAMALAESLTNSEVSRSSPPIGSGILYPRNMSSSGLFLSHCLSVVTEPIAHACVDAAAGHAWGIMVAPEIQTFYGPRMARDLSTLAADGYVMLSTTDAPQPPGQPHCIVQVALAIGEADAVDSGDAVNAAQRIVLEKTGLVLARGLFSHKTRPAESGLNDPAVPLSVSGNGVTFYTLVLPSGAHLVETPVTDASKISGIRMRPGTAASFEGGRVATVVLAAGATERAAEAATQGRARARSGSAASHGSTGAPVRGSWRD